MLPIYVLALVKLLFVFFFVLVESLRLIIFIMLFVFKMEFILFRLLVEMIVVSFVPVVLYTWAWSFVVFDIWEVYYG